MIDPIRILITAVGGDLGQALVKALRLSSKAIECYGCDMDGEGIGSAFVDTFLVVPRADDPRYVDCLDQFCCAQNVHAVVPGSELEIYVLSRLGIPPRLPGGAAIICQDASWIEMYGDKLTCMEALDGKIELAPFADGGNHQAVSRLVSEVDFPLVVKSRRSSGSRSVRRAYNQTQLNDALRETPMPLVQAFIDASNEEFSVGIFVCEYFSSAIAFRRELGPVGCSWVAETSRDDAVLKYTRRIAEITNVKGSANIQVGKTAEGIRLFEINPRFSSLVAARAACGFRDAEWSVKLALGLKPRVPKSDFKDIRFRRFFHEVIDFGDGFKAGSEWSPKESSMFS